MAKREEIVNYIIDKLTTELGNKVKSVERNYKPFELYQNWELPVVCVLPASEDRSYSGNRMTARFEVIIRLVVYDEKALTEKINQLIEDIDSILSSDPYLGGNSCFPARITGIETTANWLSPYEVADIHFDTYYTRCENW